MSGKIVWPYRMQAGSQVILQKALAPNSGFRRIGYGGPKGGGKSYGARGLAFTLTYLMPIHVCIVRSRLKAVKKNHINPAKNELRFFLEAGLLKYNDTDKMFTWVHNGGQVTFAHCERESDIEQFDGLAADLYIFEESGHLTEDMIKGIWKNNRSTELAINRGAKYPPRVLCTFNWGGRGHAFNRRVFWDKIYKDNERAEDYLFIFAPLDQNRALNDADPNYRRTLDELPEALRDAYLYGDPDAFVGTMFTIISQVHEVEPMDVLREWGGVIPKHWDLVGSLDAAAGGGTCSFGLYTITPTGKKYKIYNYYVSHANPRDHVDNIDHALTSQNGPVYQWTKGRMPDYIVADRFAFADLDRVGIHSDKYTFEGLFNAKGYILSPGNYRRVTAIMALQTALHFEYEDGILEVEPDLQFFKGMCNPTLEELKSIERDKTNPEDNAHDPDDKDDAIDETKNFVMSAQDPPNRKDIQAQREKLSDYGRRTEDRRTVPAAERLEDNMLVGALDDLC